MGPENTCGNKIPHRTQEKADKHAASLDQVSWAHRVESYPCPFCWNWHVGRPKKDGQIKYLAALRQSRTPQVQEGDMT